LESSVL